MNSGCYMRTLKVLSFFMILTTASPAVAQAPRSCRLFAAQALECLDVTDAGYKEILKTYCQSLYYDTRFLMKPGPLRKALRSELRQVSCEAIAASDPFTALDDRVTRFRIDNDLQRRFEAHGVPTRQRRWLITQRMRRERISFPHLPDCPPYDDGAMPETRICRYRRPEAPSPERPDAVLVLTGGMVTGMTLLRHAAEVVIDTLAPRMDLWVFVAESAPLHTVDIAALRWQVANLARGFVADHPGSAVVLMGFSNGAAQVYHAINEVFPRKRFAAARPALTILLDTVDATPFVERTLTIAPGPRVLAFHGAYASPAPPVHGAHRLRCVDPTACAIHPVRQPAGHLAAHAEIPGLVAMVPALRQILVDAVNAAIP
jgi:hypothetical protein